MTLGLKRVEAILLSCCLHRIIPPDKWVIPPMHFWRHSLGCALTSHKMAKLIGYPDPEKAYLAGLVHDLGILVNSVVCPETFGTCLQAARDRRIALDQSEAEQQGFTHCESGKIVAEKWKFTRDLIEVIEFHHDVTGPADRPLVELVHLADLLCRLRNLGYGYYEAMGVHLAGEGAWAKLAETYPELAKTDLVRFTIDLDGAMDEILAIVDAVFSPSQLAN